MKKVLLAASIASALSLFNVAQANTGTITFNGEITDATCEVKVNGNQNGVVTLPTVSKSLFTSTKNTAGKANFEIEASNCVMGTVNPKTKVTAYFNPHATEVDTATGFLNNRLTGADVAAGVQLRISNAVDSSVVKVGGSSAADFASMATNAVTVTGGNATMPFFVEYIAADIAAVTPGKVQGFVTYELHYE